MTSQTPEPNSACVILAGGLGARLRDKVPDLPKCLAPVGRRPFLEIQIESFIRSGITDFVLALGFLADRVERAVDAFTIRARIRTAVELQPLGTGGAIAFAMDAFRLSEALVANGDTYFDGDISGMLPALEVSRGESLRMATVSVADRQRYGGIELDATGCVTRFVEKKGLGPGPINAGLYRIHRTALPARIDGAFSLEMSVLPALAAAGHIWAREITGSMIDIGVPDEYDRFCRLHAGARSRGTPR